MTYPIGQTVGGMLITAHLLVEIFFLLELGLTEYSLHRGESQSRQHRNGSLISATPRRIPNLATTALPPQGLNLPYQRGTKSLLQAQPLGREEHEGDRGKHWHSCTLPN